MDDDATIEEGARNLLVNCAGARAGERLLILEEDPALGHYGEGLAEAIARCAERLGLSAERCPVPFDPMGGRLPEAVSARVGDADHVLWLARLGDQTRFAPDPAMPRAVVCYAVDREMLGSPFGTIDHGAMLALKRAVDAAIAGAGEIRVTCPLGTDFHGAPPKPRPDDKAAHADVPGDVPGDVKVSRFPMPVFSPIDAAGFSGRVALARFLIGTGSVYYEPFMLELADTCHVRFEGNRIIGYDGPDDACAAIRAHVGHVSTMLGLDGACVHSWHAGIHPGCAYRGVARDNPGRWGGSAFGNPRLLHFHTCGDYAPGEICWNVLDPTIVLDGVPLWEHGRLRIENLPGAAAIFESCPALSRCFAQPARDMGVD